MKVSRKAIKSYKLSFPLILSICMLFALSWFMGLSSSKTVIAAPQGSGAVITAAPIANDDAYTTTEYVSLNIPAPGVLENDTNPGGGTLTATIDTNPNNGSVFLNPDGAFVYEPNPGYSGIDVFTYVAANGDAPAVAYWPLEEGSGITTTDVTGNGFDGTLVNGSVFTTTVPVTPTFTNDYAIENDGVDDYIQTPAIDLANHSFSVAFWARRDSTNTTHMVLGQGVTSNSQGLHIGFRNNNRFTCAFWSNDLNTASTYTDSNWHHWACTYNAATNERIIYQDGVVVASDTANADYQGSGDFYFGSRFDGANSFDGLFDDVRVYLTSLTQAQVEATMTNDQLSLGDRATVTITVTAALDGMLTGDVTDISNGTNIADATIVATFNPIAVFTETTTISGTYSFMIPEETYIVMASAYGYDPAQITAVSVFPSITTTLDISLNPADIYVVDGVVTDTNTGWPLYASIDIDGYPGDPIWTNPETGYYSITLPAGTAYTFQAQAWVAGYLAESRAVGYLTGDTTENFALDINSGSCNAPGYSDGSGSCIPTAGGLIIGHAYDNNTLTPLTGSLIENEDGYTANTEATPADDNVEDGFYTIFSPTGSKTFTATMSGGYTSDIATVSVVMSTTSVHDFYLDAGWLTANPENIDVVLTMGLSTTLPLTLSNLGSVAAGYEFFEIDDGFTPVLLTSNDAAGEGTIEWMYQNTKGVAVNDTDNGATVIYPGAYKYTPSKAASDLNILVYTDDWIHTTPNTLVQDAISILGLSATVHVDGDYSGFQNSLNSGGPWDLVVWSGENNSVDASLLPDLLAYLQGGGKLAATYWRQLDWPSDPLWTEMGFTYVSNYVTPPPTYWWQPGHPLFNNPESAPEWINRVQNSGTSQGTRLEPLANGSALAGYTNSAATNEAGIILRNDGMALYKGLRDVSTNADDNGNSILDGTELWVNIFSNMLYGSDVPWVSEDPISGTVSSLGNIVVDITFDAGAVSQPGDYHANLLVSNDTPYDVDQIPVTMTVKPLAGWGKVAGNLILLGYCNANPTILANQEILIEGSSGYTTTITTDENGYYQWWIESSESPLTVTVAPVPNYSSGLVTGINVGDGMTTTVDVDLRWLEPCISATPDVYSATLDLGSSAAFSLTIENTGAISLSFELSDKSEDFTPALLQAVLIPSVEPLANTIGDSITRQAPQTQQVKTIESWLYTPSPNAYMSSAQPDVLLFASDNASTIQAMLAAYPDIGSVDYFDGRTGTPTLAQLLAYDSVVVMSNNPFSDNVAAGDVLADYLDAGGAVVQTNGTWNSGASWALAGRYLSEGYSPYEGSNSLFFATVNLGTYDATHPIMAGVSSATDNLLHNDVTLKPEASFIADWDDGEGLAATLGSVVGLNIFVSDSGNWSGDIDLILHNSIIWLTVSDAPWLLQNPISGTVAADTGSESANIIMDAALVDQPGEYLATLSISSNDPVNNALSYPVTMTVNTPATWGKVEGILTELGYCNNNPVTVSNHEILIEANSGFTATTTTDENGYYAYWIDESEGPLTLTVSAITEYSSGIASGVDIIAGQTTSVDFDLYWLQSCVTIDPASYEKVVFLGDVLTDSLELFNDGAISATFEITETSNLSWLSTDPVTGTIDVASTESADIVFDSSVLTQTGTYNGDLRVDSNDPLNGSVLIPIVMEVVSGTADVLIGPNSVLAGLSGTAVTHSFNVTNTGNVTDIYDLTLSDNTWATADPPADTSFIAPGEMFTFTIEVTIPDDPTLMSAIIGSDLFTVTATSQLDGSEAAATGTTQANVATGVAVSSDQSDSAFVGEVVTYTVMVTNTGEFTDTFTLSASGNAWMTDLSTNELILGVGQSGNVLVSVMVPLSATDGEDDDATITATSQLDNLATASLLLVTTAKEYFIYLPVISK